MKKILVLILSVCTLGVLSACSETQYAAHVVKQIPFPSDVQEHVGYFKVGSTYRIQGRKYHPKETYNLTETGTASWYGPGFHGKMTANGEIFDENELTAAHRTLQLPSIIRVTNLGNGRTLVLRVNDRGPFAHDRVLDVSKRAASLLGFKSQGTAKIRLEVLSGPSHEVANRAKSGKSTKGYEVALARGGQGTAQQATPVITSQDSTVLQRVAENPEISTAPISPLPQLKPVTRIALSDPAAAPKPPSLGAGRIYVQAGSFSNEQNALNFSNQMASYGPSKVYLSRVNNKALYRVRLGPYTNREQAATAMYNLQQSGQNAVIVTE